MRNPNAFERAVFIASVGSAVLTASPGARADEKKVCGSAYDQTQTLRREGKLQSAREQALVCMRDVCAEFVRTDCAKWLGEIDASEPSIVFDVRDAQGKETNAAKVSLDGKPWLDKLDGKAKLIDPGEHKLKFEIEGAPPLEQTVQIREGEKNRMFTASFMPSGPKVEGNGPVLETKDAGGPPDTAPSGKPSIAPWVIGGVGVVGLAVGAITGGIVLSKRSDFDQHCKGTPLTCDPQGQSDASSGKSLGPVSTIGFVAGGLGVGVATVWLVTRKPSAKPSPSVGLGTMVSPNGGGLRLKGSF